MPRIVFFKASPPPIVIPTISYLTPDIRIPYVWTFNNRTAPDDTVPNVGNGSSSAFLNPTGGPTYSHSGGLDGDYVTAAENRYFTTNVGIPETYDAIGGGGGGGPPYSLVFVFKPTRSTTGIALAGLTLPLSLRYSSATPTQVSINSYQSFPAPPTSGLVWGEWNVLFYNYISNSFRYALNLEPAVELISAVPSNAIGSPLRLINSFNGSLSPFDDQIDTIALYTNVANDNGPWNIDRPQIYARVMAKQNLATLP